MVISPEIKAFVESAGKALIIENGKPELVILSFDAYQSMAKDGAVRMAAPAPHKEATSGTIEHALTPDASRQAYVARQIDEINREIEAIAADDFFSPITDQPGGIVAHQAPFYRELE
ncbi:MAG: hypothetical protein Q8Q39_05685 [bacterium]|nr:hypothetical protein [bacterium]